jgi:hypothetical protein
MWALAAMGDCNAVGQWTTRSARRGCRAHPAAADGPQDAIASINKSAWCNHRFRSRIAKGKY